MVHPYLQAHLDLLFLGLIDQEPRDPDTVLRAVQEQFGKKFAPSRQLTYSALHYLERNRLIQPLETDPRRYALTPSGRRSLGMRIKQWELFTKEVQAVLRRRTSSG
jgi:DNA-binding PadR family transcriptional regulator